MFRKISHSIGSLHIRADSLGMRKTVLGVTLLTRCDCPYLIIYNLTLKKRGIEKEMDINRVWLEAKSAHDLGAGSKVRFVRQDDVSMSFRTQGLKARHSIPIWETNFVLYSIKCYSPYYVE